MEVPYLHNWNIWNIQIYPCVFTCSQSEEIDEQYLVKLERLKQNQRQDYLKGAVSGSIQATDRLMKELRDIYRSDSFKKGRWINPSKIQSEFFDILQWTQWDLFNIWHVFLWLFWNTLQVFSNACNTKNCKINLNWSINLNWINPFKIIIIVRIQCEWWNPPSE